MEPLPHRYAVEATADAEGPVALAAEGLETLASLPPSEFGGPGDHWSPETLLVGAVADCFALGFRAIARASSFPWTSLRCRAEGSLDRVDRVTRFTGIALHAELVVPAGSDVDKATRLLEKAERSCLVSNSLACPVTLETRVETGDQG
jgi:peroxiredoxin-like protein